MLLRFAAMRYPALATLMLAALTCLGATGTAKAQMTALEFAVPGIPNTGAYIMGWEFRVSSNVTVTSLGYYDHDGDGFASSHDVGLWDNMQNRLATTVVTNANPLVGHFRFNAIAPVVLTPGHSYFVAGNTMSDVFTTNVSGAGVASPIIYFRDRWNTGNTLIFPASSSFGGVGVGYFGANFQIDAAAAPEPGTPALLGLGALGMAAGVATRGRRCRKA